MNRAFRALWQALKDVFDDFLLLVTCNLIWFVISMPLLIATYFALLEFGIWPALLVELLAVAPLAPATVGLYVIAHRVSEGRVSKVRDFFAGMRRYAIPAWRTMGAWTVGLVLIQMNLAFYTNMGNFFGAVLYGLWFYLLFVWFGILIYLSPLILLQTSPDLKTIARNSFMMALGRPIFTLITLVLMAIVIVLTSFVPILLSLGVVALLVQWSMRATLELIKESEERRAAAEAAKAAANPLEEKGRRGQVRPK
ncbi:MAG: hypothetical protein MI924_24475 [Chloroflexales bacterium]|nr:hypothetical protein [Chloroflexales bacterium]